MLKRIIFWTLIALAAWAAHFFATERIEEYILNEIEIPRGNIIVVDQRSADTLQNGSFEHPFVSIQKALEFQSQNESFETIFLRPGEYSEMVVLPENTKMIGLEKGAVIKNPLGLRKETVTAGNNTLLSNVRILEGKYGLYIPKNVGPVTLLNCQVQSAGKWGVYNEEHDNKETKLSLIRSAITKNARQGLYLQKSSFYMNNSQANENGEEGIDLHVEMISDIKNSQIIGNGEGGLETELGNINLLIENCLFKNNGSSGINIQSFGDKSEVQIKNNIIEENKDFGVRCAIHSKEVAPYFSRMVIIGDDNIFNKNGKSRIDPNCKF